MTNKSVKTTCPVSGKEISLRLGGGPYASWINGSEEAGEILNPISEVVFGYSRGEGYYLALEGWYGLFNKAGHLVRGTSAANFRRQELLSGGCDRRVYVLTSKLQGEKPSGYSLESVGDQVRKEARHGMAYYGSKFPMGEHTYEVVFYQKSLSCGHVDQLNEAEIFIERFVDKHEKRAYDIIEVAKIQELDDTGYGACIISGNGLLSKGRFRIEVKAVLEEDGQVMFYSHIANDNYHGIYRAKAGKLHLDFIRTCTRSEYEGVTAEVQFYVDSSVIRNQTPKYHCSFSFGKIDDSDVHLLEEGDESRYGCKPLVATMKDGKVLNVSKPEEFYPIWKIDFSALKEACKVEFDDNPELNCWSWDHLEKVLAGGEETFYDPEKFFLFIENCYSLIKAGLSVKKGDNHLLEKVDKMFFNVEGLSILSSVIWIDDLLKGEVGAKELERLCLALGRLHKLATNAWNEVQEIIKYL